VQNVAGKATTGTAAFHVALPVYYAQFDRGRFYAAGEYRRQPIYGTLNFGTVEKAFRNDRREWYAMTSYRATTKLQVGTYYSHFIDVSGLSYQQNKNSKDLVFSTRFDFNSNFYAKAENHFLHGTAVGFYPDDNPQGTKSRTDLVILKLGFNF
jgi:hypothetical protein